MDVSSMNNSRSAYLHEVLRGLGEDFSEIRMDFGSDEFKYKLLSKLDDETSSNEVMTLLNVVILNHTFNRISKNFTEGEFYISKGIKCKALHTEGISPQDSYEIAGDVYCEVVKRLDKFIYNVIEKGYNEQARQAWLRKIIYCICARHLNKMGRIDFIIDIDDDDDGLAYIPKSDFKSPEYIAICNDIITGTVTLVCDAPFKPEKILGFLYNIIIFKEFEGRITNSSAKTTCEYLNGKMLFALKGNLIPAFNKIYSVKLSYDDIASLSEVLGYDSATLKGLELFDATAKLITDWSNRVKVYIYKYRKNLLDEEGVDEKNDKKI